MAFPKRWKSILNKHFNMVPGGSKFPRYKQAVKDASREYHGLVHRETATNPSRKTNWLLIGGVGVAGYMLMQRQKAQQAAAAAAAAAPHASPTG